MHRAQYSSAMRTGVFQRDELTRRSLQNTETGFVVYISVYILLGKRHIYMRAITLTFPNTTVI